METDQKIVFDEESHPYLSNFYQATLVEYKSSDDSIEMSEPESVSDMEMPINTIKVAKY